MKQILIALFVVAGICSHAQPDTTKKFGLVVGGSFGAGISLHEPTLPYNYGVLVHEKKWYAAYTVYASFLFKEKIGFRLTGGYLGGSTANSSSIDEYVVLQFPNYHYLPQYSVLHGGYHYQYLVPQASYRLGTEPFNATFSLGAGFGRLHTPHGNVILQKDGSNDFIELTYHSENMWNYHGQLDMEFAYMRQLSQHYFINVGLYVTSVALLSNYEFHYSETDYQQTYTIRGGGHSNDVMMHFHSGLFLNFQWNKRESELAYYE